MAFWTGEEEEEASWMDGVEAVSWMEMKEVS